jgi:S-adenosylmethionine:tRNA ribosyltransferase-isomerase
LDTDELDYHLPAELIAQHPPERREDARLMVVPRRGGPVEHRRIVDLGRLLRPGDLLVLNDTRVVPARVVGRRPTGGRVELLVVRELDPARCLWDVLVRGAPRPGEVLELPGGSGRWDAQRGPGRWTIALDVGGPVPTWLERVGSVPLPPYVRRAEGPTERDRERYQTVLARQPGAVAAPTAGLHFTRALLDELAAAGIEHVTVTLHVGPGTFLPIRTGPLDRFEMEPEAYEITGAAAERIEDTRASRGRIVAVGTTTCRALESASEGGRLRPGSGWAGLFIRPGHVFRATDALLTNFHLPRTPLLALVSALTGWERLREAYAVAVRERYRFYSFGDAMVVL